MTCREILRLATLAQDGNLNNRNMREEKDSLGSLPIPDDVYYGIQTLRAVENYPISGITVHPAFIRAYASLKKACLLANVTSGAFTDETKADAILKACDEVIKGKFDD